MSASQRLRIADPSEVGEARRVTANLCAALGFDTTHSGKAAIVVTELATNLSKHARGGELLLRSLDDRGVAGLEIVSVDRGPGLLNPGECLRDGYSTSGSPGTGLGAIRRLSSLFDIFTQPGKGTAVLSRVWNAPPRRMVPGLFEAGAVCLPAPGETVAGDSWTLYQGPHRALLMIADGLGHGPAAAEASAAAVAAFARSASLSPSEVVVRLHAALQAGRGAAVAVAELNTDARIARYAGIGNIAGVIISPDWSRSLVSFNGTAGVSARKIQEFSYPWPEHALLVMHSDGLTSRWTLDDYPGLRAHHPALIAAVLARDHARGRDDLTVVALRQRGEQG